MSYLCDHMRATTLPLSHTSQFMVIESCFLAIYRAFSAFFLCFLWLEREESSDSKNDMVLVVIMDHAVHVHLSR